MSDMYSDKINKKYFTVVMSVTGPYQKFTYACCMHTHPKHSNFCSDHDDNNDDKHTSYKIHFNFQRRTLHVPLNFLSLFVFFFLFNSFFMFNFSFLQATIYHSIPLFCPHRHLMQQLDFFCKKEQYCQKCMPCDTMRHDDYAIPPPQREH